MRLFIPLGTCESHESIAHYHFRASTWSEGQSSQDFQCCVLHKDVKGTFTLAQCMYVRVHAVSCSTYVFLQEPAERARLYFLLAWFHAVVQERLHYSPLGWAKKYEFNESDLRMACDTLDTWLDMVAQVGDCTL